MYVGTRDAISAEHIARHILARVANQLANDNVATYLAWDD
jgi:hypothetical protein